MQHQCKVMLTFLEGYNFRTFVVLTGNTIGREEFISSLTDMAENLSNADKRYEILAEVQILSLDSATLHAKMQEVKNTETRVILLHASLDEAGKIFAVAKNLGLTGKEFVWLVTKSVVVTPGAFQESDDPDQPVIKAPKEFPVGTIATYFSHEVPVMENVIKDMVKLWFDAVNILVQDVEDNQTGDIDLSPEFNCSSNLTYWNDSAVWFEYLVKSKEKEPDPYDINPRFETLPIKMQIMNLKRGHTWAQIGTWSETKGLELNDITWPGDSPLPPKGRPEKYQLKVVTLKERPFVVYNDVDPATGKCPPLAHVCRVGTVNDSIINEPNVTTNSSLYRCCSGFCIDLLRMLSNKIGFEYELFEVSDKKWGGFNEETKEWNGLVRAVMDHKADMVVASLSITPERNSAIDFSVPFLETGITIIVAVRDGVISPTAFLEPYDYPSWCLILVFSVHASGAAIFIFEWLSPSGLDRGNKPIREHRFSLFRSFWLIWAMLFGAAVNVDDPRGVSSRFMANIWALFAVVFTASYTANLAAFMITKEDYDRLDGIHDWRLKNPYAHKPPFKFATIPHGSTEAYFMKKWPDIHKYMKNFNRSTVQDGVKALKDTEINAFIYDATVLEYQAAHDDGCKLRTVGRWHAMMGYGIGVPKGSKWLDTINRYLTQFQHEGEMERLQKFWFAGACSQKKEEGESTNSLGILNFTSAFILLAGGMLLGGLLLLLEHIYFKFLRVKLRKWDKCGCCGLVSLSMGKSLTFEQSVREAMEMTRAFKCQNPVCETSMWKTKHELDMALLKIERLKNQLKKLGVPPEKVSPMRDKEGTRRPPAIGWKDETQVNRPLKLKSNSSHPLGNKKIRDSRENPEPVPNRLSAVMRQGSQSLPNSPSRKKLEQSYSSVNKNNHLSDSEERNRLRRTRSVTDTGDRISKSNNDRNEGSGQDRKPASDQRTKYKDGHYYVAIDKEDTKVEKETVL